MNNPPFSIGQTGIVTNLMLVGKGIRFTYSTRLNALASAEVFSFGDWIALPKWDAARIAEAIKEKEFTKATGKPNFKWIGLVQIGDYEFDIEAPYTTPEAEAEHLKKMVEDAKAATIIAAEVAQAAL